MATRGGLCSSDPNPRWLSANALGRPRRSPRGGGGGEEKEWDGGALGDVSG